MQPTSDAPNQNASSTLFHRVTRRTAIAAGATAALGGLGDFAFLSSLNPVSAADAALDADTVRFGSDIEPMVRLIETTPRDKLIDAVGAKVRGGTSYRHVLAALLLAGVRNVQPRPSVGFKFHAVLVVNSAHLASVSGPPSDRWLPIFWAIDHFKSAQARDVREGDWTMSAVDESAVPKPHRARQAFIEAMNKWDVPAADAAVAQLARTHGANDVFEMFFRLGSRDFRSIGHKAIYVANAFRTLQCIGWQHAEPVLRSLAYALLNHSGEANPATSDHAADRPGRDNRALAKKMRDDWLAGKRSDDASAALLDVLRQGSPADAAQAVAKHVNSGVAPQSMWDAMFAMASELVLRQPAIVPLHAATCTNAIYFAYQQSADDTTRRWLMLQNASFLALFRQAAERRRKLGDANIQKITPTENVKPEPAAVTRIFADVGRDRPAAAAGTLAYLRNNGDPQLLIDAARRLVFLKGNDAHDYKFSSAVLEDYAHLSPGWRDRYLAGCTALLNGSSQRDNGLVTRIRGALASS